MTLINDFLQLHFDKLLQKTWSRFRLFIISAHGSNDSLPLLQLHSFYFASTTNPSVKIWRNYPRDLVVVRFFRARFRFRFLSLMFDVACGLISVKISPRVGRFITINIWIGRTRKYRPQRRFPTCFSLWMTLTNDGATLTTLDQW